MSVKCEQPIDELTVQVWLLYHNPNFKYCTLFVSGTGRDGITDGQTDKRTNRRTDDPNTRCPRRTFQAGGIKSILTKRSQKLFLTYTCWFWSFHSKVWLVLVIRCVTDVLWAQSRFVRFVWGGGGEAKGWTPYTFNKPTLGPKYNVGQ